MTGHLCPTADCARSHAAGWSDALGFSAPKPFTAIEAYAEGWPTFAQTWLGGEYPTGRGQQADPQPGWQCPGCQRCYAPAQIQCRFCGPAEDSGATRDLTWTPDAMEPDADP